MVLVLEGILTGVLTTAGFLGVVGTLTLGIFTGRTFGVVGTLTLGIFTGWTFGVVGTLMLGIFTGRTFGVVGTLGATGTFGTIGTFTAGARLICGMVAAGNAEETAKANARIEPVMRCFSFMVVVCLRLEKLCGFRSWMHRTAELVQKNDFF